MKSILWILQMISDMKTHASIATGKRSFNESAYWIDFLHVRVCHYGHLVVRLDEKSVGEGLADSETRFNWEVQTIEDYKSYFVYNISNVKR